MCGIAGTFEIPAQRDGDGLRAIATAMAGSLAHRGPDDSGIWVDPVAGIALAHQRLSVLDLSPAGHQPMLSACGRFAFVYNGEVYNATAIRRELGDIAFRGHSDTEVVLEGCARWGIEATARRLIGMFAFALWDRAERRLTLVRDRLGIKPLYWGTCGHSIVFGSELRALRTHPSWSGTIDRNALTAYVRFGYVPAPMSIHSGIHKLQPGRILTFQGDREPTESTFWSLAETVRNGQAAALGAMSEAEATDALDGLLHDAVGQRMIADVPLGTFLSGGIDSSTVAALMQAQSDRPIKTFSIGFREPGFDESTYAAAVARHLGTDHTELFVTAADALDVIPRLSSIYDEPFADSSQIPTFLLSVLTRQHVTVALSGDGGDELFAGYTRYAFTRSLAAWLEPVPVALRNAAAGALRAVPPAAWDRLFGYPATARFVPSHPGDKLHKLASILGADADAIYLGLVSQWPNPGDIVAGGNEVENPLTDGVARALVTDLTSRMQYLDTLTYLPDDILTKVDRASMATALEVRVPLLDHRVVEFSWRLPHHFKVRDRQGKWLLRRVLDRYVPASLINRPKMGFGVPLGNWLRGPLRDWAETLLAPERLAADGLFEPPPIRAAWSEHLSGRHNQAYRLWTILMFQAWRETYGTGAVR